MAKKVSPGIFVPVQDTEDLKKVASKQSKPIQETGDDDSEAATDSKDNKIPRYRVVRGLCLIMCSMPVNNALKVKMRKVFERLRFDVLYVEVGRKSFDLLRALEAYKGMSSRYDCFLCFVFSSGDERGVLGRDGEVVTVSQITGVFDVPELSGKPKLFILHLKQLDREIRACSDTNIAPNQGRMMDLFHVAQVYNEADNEPLYAEEFLDVLQEYAENEDFLNLVTTVNARIGCVEHTSSLQKVVQFCPRNVNVMENRC